MNICYMYIHIYTLSTPGAPKKQQKVDEVPLPLTDAREGLKTFVAKSLRKLLGAQLLMHAAYRFYKILPPPRSQNIIQVFRQTKCNYSQNY